MAPEKGTAAAKGHDLWLVQAVDLSLNTGHVPLLLLDGPNRSLEPRHPALQSRALLVEARSPMLKSGQPSSVEGRGRGRPQDAAAWCGHVRLPPAASAAVLAVDKTRW